MVKDDGKNSPVGVKVVYKPEYDYGTVDYKSLVDLWSRWYG